MELSGNLEVEELLKNVSHEVQTRWLELYKPEFIKLEAVKAKTWLIANPEKKRTNIGAFMNNWLSRNGDNQGVSRTSYRKETAQEKQERILNMENPYA